MNARGGRMPPYYLYGIRPPVQSSAMSRVSRAFVVPYSGHCCGITIHNIANVFTVFNAEAKSYLYRDPKGSLSLFCQPERHQSDLNHIGDRVTTMSSIIASTVTLTNKKFLPYFKRMRSPTTFISDSFLECYKGLRSQWDFTQWFRLRHVSSFKWFLYSIELGT